MFLTWRHPLRMPLSRLGCKSAFFSEFAHLNSRKCLEYMKITGKFWCMLKTRTKWQSMPNAIFITNNKCFQPESNERRIRVGTIINGIRRACDLWRQKCNSKVFQHSSHISYNQSSKIMDIFCKPQHIIGVLFGFKVVSSWKRYYSTHTVLSLWFAIFLSSFFLQVGVSFTVQLPSRIHGVNAQWVYTSEKGKKQ